MFTVKESTIQNSIKPIYFLQPETLKTKVLICQVLGIPRNYWKLSYKSCVPLSIQIIKMFFRRTNPFLSCYKNSDIRIKEKDKGPCKKLKLVITVANMKNANEI
jgi:hypothetical protein